MMTIEETAREVLRCALTHEPDSCLIGNVTALEIARLAASRISTCPKCGADAGSDIDCGLCAILAVLEGDPAKPVLVGVSEGLEVVPLDDPSEVALGRTRS